MFWPQHTFETDPFFQNFASFGSGSGIRRLQDEMNRLFEGSRGAVGADFPPVSVWANSDRAVVVAEVPGIQPSAVDVSVLGDTLTIKGERTALQPGEGDRYLRRERGSGHFSRVVELPFPVDGDHVSAEYGQGILTITLPRAAADKPKKITIR